MDFCSYLILLMDSTSVERRDISEKDLRNLLANLPEFNRNTVLQIIHLLSDLSAKAADDEMSADAIAIVSTERRAGIGADFGSVIRGRALATSSGDVLFPRDAFGRLASISLAMCLSRLRPVLPPITTPTI